MSNTVLEWPKADVDRLFAAMELGRRYLNYDSGKALRAAAGSLVRALGTSTKVAPKYRAITESLANTRRKDLKAFDITGYFGAPRRLATRTVFSKSLANAKRIHALIGRAGLAKKTWTADPAMSSGLAGSVMARQVDQRTANVAKKYVRVTKQFAGDDQFFELKNSLPYIEDALVGGANATQTAMSRAASGLEKSIEKQLVKRMGLGKLSR